MKTTLALILLALAFPALAAPTPKKNPPSTKDLQEKIIDLQEQLLTCQKSAQDAASNPTKDALEAFRTFNSTIETGGGQQAYQNALIPLKITVDRLPENDTNAPLKKLLEQLVDVQKLHGTRPSFSDPEMREIARDGWVKGTLPYLAKYPDVWDAVTKGFVQREGDVTKVSTHLAARILDLHLMPFVMALRKNAQDQIKALPRQPLPVINARP